MTATQTETVGQSENLAQFFLEEEVVLVSVGINVPKFKRTLGTKLDRAVQLNAKQENLKRDLKDLTVEVEAAMADLYQTFSGYVDACAGALGKSTATAKNLQRLRSRVRMPDSPPQVAVEPNPGATQ